MSKPPLSPSSKALFDRFADGVTESSRRWGKKGWLIFLVVFTFVLITQFSLPSLGKMIAPHPEIRGVWITNVDSDVLFRSDKTANAIATLGQMNFNTLYPTVWNWGYTLYPSQTAQKATGQKIAPHPGLQGRDVLREITESGHRQGMTVIPWFEFGFMAPADSTLVQRHPEWITQRQNKQTVWLEGKIHKRVWLNPLHPGVQRLITDLVVEVLQKYDVDGIQFDDHFGYASDFGYDPYTVKLYRDEHQCKAPPNNAQDPEWVRWRADKITEFMVKLTSAIKRTRPDAIVSLSPNPQDFSLNSYLLDWYQWEELGLIDEVVLQVYRFDMEAFQRELNHMAVQTTKHNIPFAVGILSGLKGRPVPIQQIQEQVAEARQQQFQGVSFFFYESLWNFGLESPRDRQNVFKALFAQPATRPTRRI